ncbi:hypothetical protein [Aliarcobacter cryaerophilus]|uniref:hypothetical protein n=1 Tax=Aliarcobacter cryaerophilus TaxID=28198 RepID=UPI0021B526E3|nr:hypothetical protein [Aliarcobacter cryaerophilus]MCT7519081.1 hypothetical protein [Aliarcobacter cryaerophilus]
MNYVQEIEKVKKELKSVLINLQSKFTVEEIIYSDSITINSIDLSKKEFKMFLNYSYFIEEGMERTTKKTRANLFYLSLNKIMTYKEKKPEKLDYIFSNCLKLYYLFKSYKNLREGIEIHLNMKFNKLCTKNYLALLKSFDEHSNEEISKELNSLSKEDYEEYIALDKLMKSEDQEAYFMKYKRKIN